MESSVCVLVSYPAGEHLYGAVVAGRGDAEVQDRGDLEAEEAHGVQRAPEGAGRARLRLRLHRREALQRPGVEQGLHAGGVPQELADAALARQPVQEPDALPPPRRQPGPPP